MVSKRESVRASPLGVPSTHAERQNGFLDKLGRGIAKAYRGWKAGVAEAKSGFQCLEFSKKCQAIHNTREAVMTAQEKIDDDEWLVEHPALYEETLALLQRLFQAVSPEQLQAPVDQRCGAKIGGYACQTRLTLGNCELPCDAIELLYGNLIDPELVQTMAQLLPTIWKSSTVDYLRKVARDIARSQTEAREIEGKLFDLDQTASKASSRRPPPPKPVCENSIDPITSKPLDAIDDPISIYYASETTDRTLQFRQALCVSYSALMEFMQDRVFHKASDIVMGRRIPLRSQKYYALPGNQTFLDRQSFERLRQGPLKAIYLKPSEHIDALLTGNPNFPSRVNVTSVTLVSVRDF